MQDHVDVEIRKTATARSVFDVHRRAVSHYFLMAHDAQARGEADRAQFYRQRAKHHADCADRWQVRSLQAQGARGWG